jgi:hypothetical protein
MESTPRFPQSLEIAARFPHSPQADDEADGKVENQNQVSHFPTARFSPLEGQKNNPPHVRSSVPSGNNPPEATGKIIVVKRKK